MSGEIARITIQFAGGPKLSQDYDLSLVRVEDIASALKRALSDHVGRASLPARKFEVIE